MDRFADGPTSLNYLLYERSNEQVKDRPKWQVKKRYPPSDEQFLQLPIKKFNPQKESSMRPNGQEIEIGTRVIVSKPFEDPASKGQHGTVIDIVPTGRKDVGYERKYWVETDDDLYSRWRYIYEIELDKEAMLKYNAKDYSKLEYESIVSSIPDTLQSADTALQLAWTIKSERGFIPYSDYQKLISALLKGASDEDVKYFQRMVKKDVLIHAYFLPIKEYIWRNANIGFDNRKLLEDVIKQFGLDENQARGISKYMKDKGLIQGWNIK